MSRDALVRAAWISHAALLTAVTVGILTSTLPAAARVALAGAAALPLVAAIPGLRRRRQYTYQWLAFVLVGYAGAASVEVVATSGGSPFATIALLAALVELGLLFTMSRASRSPPQSNHE
jgi:uncharacterized membrane protein